MLDSVHKKLEKVRKPRVHITYDVETEGAQVKKELPFVLGVLSDFAGDGAQPAKALKDRKFIQIDGDNFSDVMTKIGPALNFKVNNTLKGDDSEFAVELKFNSMEDFEPAKVVEQIEPLRRLIETRHKLSDLLSKADRSEKLEKLLEEALQNTEHLSALAKELGVGSTGDAEGNKQPEGE